jgi:hypothetical protein
MKDIKEMGLKETFFDIPNRILTFVWKLLSVKVMIMFMAFWLIWTGKVTGWEGIVLFLVTSLIVIFGRESIKFLEALKGLK